MALLTFISFGVADERFQIILYGWRPRRELMRSEQRHPPYSTVTSDRTATIG